MCQTAFEVEIAELGLMRRVLLYTAVVANPMCLDNFPFDVDDVQVNFQSNGTAFAPRNMESKGLAPVSVYSVEWLRRDAEGRIVAPGTGAHPLVYRDDRLRVFWNCQLAGFILDAICTEMTWEASAIPLPLACGGHRKRSSILAPPPSASHVDSAPSFLDAPRDLSIIPEHEETTFNCDLGDTLLRERSRLDKGVLLSSAVADGVDDDIQVVRLTFHISRASTYY